jgi:hypothetical protein
MYLLTVTDMSTRWVEAILLMNIETSMCKDAFIAERVACFGGQNTVPTDRETCHGSFWEYVLLPEEDSYTSSAELVMGTSLVLLQGQALENPQLFATLYPGFNTLMLLTQSVKVLSAICLLVSLTN